MFIPVVWDGDSFELDALRDGCERYERFLFMKPSVTVLDEAFWDAIENTEGAAWLFARPSCYLAIYTRETLAHVLEQAPTAVDKQTSIIWESRLHDLLDYPTIWPDVSDRKALRVDTINGNPELVIGNSLVEKAKGTAHCPRCPHAPVPGLCRHYLRRFRVPDTAR